MCCTATVLGYFSRLLAAVGQLPRMSLPEEIDALERTATELNSVLHDAKREPAHTTWNVYEERAVWCALRILRLFAPDDESRQELLTCTTADQDERAEIAQLWALIGFEMTLRNVGSVFEGLAAVDPTARELRSIGASFEELADWIGTVTAPPSREWATARVGHLERVLREIGTCPDRTIELNFFEVGDDDDEELEDDEEGESGYDGFLEAPAFERAADDDVEDSFTRPITPLELAEALSFDLAVVFELGLLSAP